MCRAQPGEPCNSVALLKNFFVRGHRISSKALVSNRLALATCVSHSQVDGNVLHFRDHHVALDLAPELFCLLTTEMFDPPDERSAPAMKQYFGGWWVMRTLGELIFLVLLEFERFCSTPHTLT